MIDSIEVSRLLDILGNRNRRRIIELLRQKPCFVTEISDRLILSPKAVIEHLNIMEKGSLISFFLDERRRKYYYLSQEFNIVVSLHEHGRRETTARIPSADLRLIESLGMLRRMAHSREALLNTLENLEKDIEATMNDIARMSRDMMKDELGLDIIFTLSHQDLTLEELSEVMEIDDEMIKASLSSLIARGIVRRENDRYRIEGLYAR